MIRVGVDIGGTKIEAAALDADGAYVARVRKPNPGDYDAFLQVVKDVVEGAEREAGQTVARVGIGMPGSISTKTGLIRNANSVWMNGRPMREDLARALGRPVRMENDANCFALSEATDGAAAGARVVFGAILGTGCGGGVVVDGRTLEGRNGVAGEWGHTPLPWPSKDEHQAHQCWCGRIDCLETWTSGSAFVEDYERATGLKRDGATIIAAARKGEAAAEAALDRYIGRLGRALASMCNLLDPDVIVLGGGMSNVEELYDRLPPVVAHYIFSDSFETPIRKATHGDSSGVRGAAWLWPVEG
ncbi:MAG: ROK family protein [Caulobacter sp.]|nr:ROK family protein [Caulobacter sp.]